MNSKVKIYTGILFLLTVVSAGLLMTRYAVFDWRVYIFWFFMAFLSETFMIKLPGGKAVSVGLAISLAVIIIGGPLTAAFVMSMGVISRVPVMEDGKRVHIFKTHPVKTIFNFSEMFLTTAAAGMVYLLTGGQTGAFSILPTIFLILSYVFINSFMIAMLFKLLNGGRFLQTWRDINRGFLVNTVAVGMLGIILALADISFSIWAVLLFLGPLFLARYSFKLYLDIKKNYFDTIESLNRTLEAKDPYTSGHATRVGEFSIAVALEMKLGHTVLERIKAASVLHDIGKIGIEDSILNKPGLLDEDEYEKIKKHPEIGSKIIGDVDFLKDVSKIVRHHHERWDGTGYPDGLTKGEIPLESRILAAADMYDAMTSDRPYRDALTDEQALAELVRCRGTQICPDVCDAFLSWLSTHKTMKRDE